MYNLGLIRMHITGLNKHKVHDALFHVLYLLSKNLEILLVHSKQSNVNVAL